MGGQTDRFRRRVTTAAQTIADVSPLPVFLTLPDAGYVYLNKPLLRLNGTPDASPIMAIARIFDPVSLQSLTSFSREAGGATTATLGLCRSDGTTYEATFRITFAYDDDGQLFLYGTTLRDEDERKRSATTEEIIRELGTTPAREQQRLSLETQIYRFAERSGDGLLVLDEHGKCSYANSMLERLFDHARGEMLGKSLEEFVRPTNRDAFIRRVAQRIHAREGGTQTIEILVEGLGRREISFRWYPISERPRATGFVISDVTTHVIRRRARHALAALSAASESSEILAGVRKALRAERVVLVSVWQDAEAEFSIEAIVDGSESPAALAPEIDQEIAKSIRTYLKDMGSVRNAHQLQLKTLGGSEQVMLLRPVESISGRVEGFLIIFLEICPDGWQVYEEVVADFARRMTARFEFRRNARDVVERRKRESLEQLARGIAHDFNNVLMSVYGHLQLIDRKLAKSSDTKLARNLEHALRSAERGKQLVQAMIAYSENALPTMVEIKLASLIKEVLAELRDRTEGRVSIHLQLDDKAKILGDPTTMRNAIEALILNALDAISAADSIREDTAPLSDVRKPHIGIEVRRSRRSDGKEEVHLIVSDNGSGMSEETRERIFDPFFTTRSPGKGVGLGMSVVQATVARMQGTIEVSSRDGRGTVVTISFPLFREVTEDRPIRHTESFRSSDTQRMRALAAKHVLVVDDAADQRELIVECLRDAGYSTEDVGDGLKAFEIVRERARDFDLVIMDRLMPTMNGDEAVAMMLEEAPNLPIVVLSGFIDPDTRANLRAMGVASCLQKPVGIADLITAIDSILKKSQHFGQAKN